MSYFRTVFVPLAAASMFFLAAGMSPSCTENKAELSVSQSPSSSVPSQLVPFSQPKLELSGKAHVGGGDDLRKIPQGLCVVDKSGNCAKVGKLDRSKPTVIYTHGWTKTGEAENVESAAKWVSKFNVLLFRWHHSSYDPKLVPHDAEARIWAEQGDGRGPVFLYATSEFKRMTTALGKSYKEEIRLVGHSLGAQVVVALAAQLVKENADLQPVRIELLDPAVIGLNSIESKGIPNMSQKDNSRTTAAKSFRAQMIKFKMDTFELPFVENKKAVAAYLSATGFLDFRFKEDGGVEDISAGFDGNLQQTKQCLVRDLFLKSHTQKLAGGLFGLAALWAGLNETERHQAIRKYYFDSIDQKVPMTDKGSLAFSAARSTRSIIEIGTPLNFNQIEGEKTVSMGDDKYRMDQPNTACLGYVNIGTRETKIEWILFRSEW